MNRWPYLLPFLHERCFASDDSIGWLVDIQRPYPNDAGVHFIQIFGISVVLASLGAASIGFIDDDRTFYISVR